ncbi:MAG: hypothetical protein ACI915_004103 [Gammaproteobacteria bacterium]|jgi:hypothetical protein
MSAQKLAKPKPRRVSRMWSGIGELKKILPNKAHQHTGQLHAYLLSLRRFHLATSTMLQSRPLRIHCVGQVQMNRPQRAALTNRRIAALSWRPMRLADETRT